MRELSLFTGAGGGILGSKMLGWRTVGYVEYEDYPQRVIAQRIEDGFYDQAPIFGDIRTFISEGYADAYQGMVDIVSGGFPCQPFSVAGRQRAGDDERDMWPYTIEVIRRVRPRWAFLENVPGLLSAADDVHDRYFGKILGELAEAGYDAEWAVLGADDVGAPHRRKRLWILSHAADDGSPSATGGVRSSGVHGQVASRPIRGSQLERDGGTSEHLADTTVEGSQERSSIGSHQEQEQSPAKRGGDDTGWWIPEPRLDRVANGVANRVDRIKAIGNGQVPQTMAAAFLALQRRFG